MSPSLTFNTKFAYGFGQLAEGLKNAALGTFVLFYYNQVLGLPGTLAGLAVAVALVFDAVTDPLAGSISDNWRGRLGRRHPFMYASAIPLAISFYLLFSPPEGLSEFALFLWLTVTIIATRGSMTLYHVPHIALGAELSEDYQERSQIVSFRYVMSFVGFFLCYGLGFAWFFRDTSEFPNGQFNVAAYEPFALSLSVLMVVSIFWSAKGTQHRIPHLPQATGEHVKLSMLGVVSRMLTDTWLAIRNPYFAWLFAGAMVIFVMVGVDGALNLYIFEYFWELDSQGKLFVLLVYPVGIIVGSIVSPFTHRYINKRTGVIIGALGWSVLQVIPIVLRMLDWFPENGSDLLVPTLVAVKFIQGVFSGNSLVSFNSMLADIADAHEVTTGKRQEGIFFAAASFATKATSGAGSLLAGIGLDLINWPRGAHIQSASDIPPETLMWLGLFYGPIVAAFAVFNVIFNLKCKMTRETHEETVLRLDELRAERASRA
ncbi:MAG: MFS transporter [Pseudomonadaceae bacterium]|nr:MFS transporter [Pseudomonadaceae bacterium]